MKKILFLLLGLAIAVSASAGVETWNQQHDAIKQKRHQMFDQRFKSHNLQHKSTTPTKLRGEGPEVITEQPEGQAVTYQRSGSYSNYGNAPQPQTGFVVVVYDPDGTTVHVKGLVTQVYECGWVSGTIANGKITIPLGQYIYTYYDDEGEYYYGLYLDWGSLALDQNYGYYEYTPDPSVTEVTYTIDGDNIVMDNSNGGNDGDGATGLVAMWDDGDSYYVCEWNTEFTPYEIDVPTVITTQPEGEVMTYKHGAYTLRSNYGLSYSTDKTKIVYAPDGVTVYIRDLFSNYNPGTWIRGTISGNKIHVPLEQYIYFELVDGSWSSLAWGTSTLDSESGLFQFTKDPTVTEVTYTIDGDIIYMDNSDLGDNGDGATGLHITIYYDGEYDYGLECNSLFSPYVEPSVIEDQPQGVLKTYMRSGIYTIAEYFYEQEGSVNIVFDPDGETVYIQNIICDSSIGSWVKGTIENGKIHVPMNQYLTWNGPKGSEDGWGLLLAFGQTKYDENDGYYYFDYDPNITEATFTINGNTISIDNTSLGPNNDMNGATGLVCVYSDEPTYYLQCDINTVFSLLEIIYEQPEGELVTYSRSGYTFDWSGEANPQEGTANVVFAPDGETVYIQDIIYNGPGTWVSGTIQNGKIHVPLGQLIAIIPQSAPTKRRAIPGNRDQADYIVLAAGQTVPDPNYPGDYILECDPNLTEITFSISDNSIILDNTCFGPNGDADGAMVIAATFLDYPQYFYQCDLLTVFGEPEAVPTVITNQPEGELVTYLRAGSGIWSYEEVMKKASDSKYINEWINLNTQWGEVNVVYAPDGQTVYLQDPVYCNMQCNRGTWVQGTLSADGSKITVPLGQYVYWDEGTAYGEKLAWGSTSIEAADPDDPDYEQNVIFTPDNSVTEVTYTIRNGCIFMDNSEGPTADEYYGLKNQYYDGQIDNETFETEMALMLQTTGLAYVNKSGVWTNEINWDTKYAIEHPAMLPEPVIYSWHEAENSWGNTYLEVQVPEFDVDGLPIYEENLSYSIYTDNDELFTFEASKYNIDEDMTEIAFNIWDNQDWDLYIGYPTFNGTWSEETNSFVPFFDWRIGIQFHYTVDGVKNSTGITYIEVYEKPEDPVTPGDVNGDNEVKINDVTALIDLLLGSDAIPVTIATDVNGDGRVTIADVTALIGLLLSGN